MKVKYVTVGESGDGQRLDNFLFKLLKGVPKSHVYRIIRSGEVRLDKKRAKVNARLVPGMQIRIPPVNTSAPKELTLTDRAKSSITNNILFEDSNLLVLNKPSGMAVHGGSGISLGVIESARLCFPDTNYIELVHRLDRDTSGCLLLAKKRSVLRQLHQQLIDKTMTKTYWALLQGRWKGPSFRKIEAPLLKNNLKSGERMVEVNELGKSAMTEFSLLENFTDSCLVAAKPITGRTHQIRVHAQSFQQAIIGDEKYGLKFINKRFKQCGVNRLFLHAKRIEFEIDEQRYEFDAPLDDKLQQVLAELGSSDDG